MSATVASRRVYDAFLGEDLSERTFYHGHSYSGRALAAAVALRHLQLLSEWSVLDNVRARSEQLAKALDAEVAAKPTVADVRLRGLARRRRRQSTSRVLCLERLPRPHPTSGCDRRRPRRPRPVGRGLGGGSADRRVPTGPLRARA